MSQAPLVSVIIPAYNADAFIEYTLVSVLSQTYHYLEVIVIDDGSQDRTVEVIQSIAQLDRRVILLQQPNSGVAVARNSGIQHSKAGYIAPIDADDIWHPQYIEKQMQCMLTSGAEVGLVYAWSEDINESGLRTGGFCASPIEGRVHNTLVCHNFLGNASATVIRRKCFEEIGGYNWNLREKNAQGCEDWDLYLRIAECYQFRVVPWFLVGYRKVSSSMSGDYTQMARSHALVMEGVQQRHPKMPAVLFRLSSSGLYMHFAHESNRSLSHRTTLFWVGKALRAGQLIACFRTDLYFLWVQSLIALWRSHSQSTDKIPKPEILVPASFMKEVPHRRQMPVIELAKCQLLHYIISGSDRLRFSRVVSHPYRFPSEYSIISCADSQSSHEDGKK